MTTYYYFRLDPEVFTVTRDSVTDPKPDFETWLRLSTIEGRAFYFKTEFETRIVLNQRRYHRKAQQRQSRAARRGNRQTNQQIAKARRELKRAEKQQDYEAAKVSREELERRLLAKRLDDRPEHYALF